MFIFRSFCVLMKNFRAKEFLAGKAGWIGIRKLYTEGDLQEKTMQDHIVFAISACGNDIIITIR